MGSGPRGSGVTITKAEAFTPSDESPQERALRERKERRARIDAHQAADRAFQAEQAARFKKEAPHEDKMLREPSVEDKAGSEEHEGPKGTQEDADS